MQKYIRFLFQKTPHSRIEKSSSRSGFTLLELVFSLSFITVLFLTLLALIIYMTGTYQKGLVIRAIDSSGREIIDDITRSISAAPAKSAEIICQHYYSKRPNAYTKCVSDGAYRFYQTVTTRSVTIVDGDPSKSVPIHGAICTGRYSYVWNSGYAIKKLGNTALATVNGISDFHLLKILDSDLEICASHVSLTSYGTISSNTYKTGTDHGYDLLPRTEDNLALYDLQLFRSTQSLTTNQSFNSATFILGTVANGVDITGTGEFCKDVPDGLSTDYNYCAINKFNFATYSTGKLTDKEENDEKHRINFKQ